MRQSTEGVKCRLISLLSHLVSEDRIDGKKGAHSIKMDFPKKEGRSARKSFSIEAAELACHTTKQKGET